MLFRSFPNKAEVIEYLRRLSEKAGTILVLVCHTSESYLLNKYDHIRTRIGCVCELLPPTIEDVEVFAREQCEVKLDAEVIAEVKQKAASIRGVKITKQPQFLRHFTCECEWV